MKQRSPKKDGPSKNLSKFAVLFVLGICLVGFTLNMGFFSFFRTAQSGSLVVVDYTIHDAGGDAVLTSVQSVVEENYAEGKFVALSQPLVLEADSQLDPGIINIDLLYPQGQQFALLSSEIDSLSTGVVGMRKNDRKIVPIDFGMEIKKNMTAEEFENIGFNFSVAQPGDRVALGISDTPVIGVDNTTPVIPVRIATVTEKYDDGLMVDYGYSSAEISVQDIRS